LHFRLKVEKDQMKPSQNEFLKEFDAGKLIQWDLNIRKVHYQIHRYYNLSKG
jgi:hypothetical protein